MPGGDILSRLTDAFIGSVLLAIIAYLIARAAHRHAPQDAADQGSYGDVILLPREAVTLGKGRAGEGRKLVPSATGTHKTDGSHNHRKGF